MTSSPLSADMSVLLCRLLEKLFLPSLQFYVLPGSDK